ncbi:MAG: hypothetical protein IKI33_01130 [Eubacterium sp.]|nr:hypothetical protein [Eubacterium sp.]
MSDKLKWLFGAPMKALYILLPLVLRAVTCFIGLNSAFNIAFYALMAFGAVMLALSALCKKNYAPPFENTAGSALSLFSCVLSAGFFTEFVNRCISVYYAVQSMRYLVLLAVLIRVFSALFALLSTVYFILAALSFGKGHYDFRFLKLLHLTPMLWAFARLLEAMEHAGVDTDDVSGGLLKYIMFAAALCFFFCFAREVENKNGAKRVTVMFSFELVLFSLLYTEETVLTLIIGRAKGFSYEMLLVLTALSLCLFSLVFVKNIIKNTCSEN